MPQSKKGAAGIGTIRKKTVTRNGRDYIFWEARYTVGFDPGTGKQVQRSISGKTQKEVRQKLQAATSAIAAGTYVAPCKMTLGQWLDIWKAEYLGGVKPLTLKDYYIQIDAHIKPALGAVRLDGLEPHMIQRFYNTMSDREGNPLSPKTIKNVHGVLHKALQQAIANGYISQNPSSACVLPKVQKPEIKPLEPSEIALFLKEADKDSYGNLFTVAIFTGMRQGELLGLSWENVDFANGVIHVKQQLQCKDGEYFFCTPKSGKGRTITPASIVMEALQQEWRNQRFASMEAGEAWDNPNNLVFTDALGKNLVRRTVVKHFKAVAQRVGIPDARFHDLRHSFAVTSLQAGDDIKTVQANLGHVTAAFTLDVYGHVTEKMKRDSATRMQKFYESIRETNSRG